MKKIKMEIGNLLIKKNNVGTTMEITELNGKVFYSYNREYP